MDPEDPEDPVEVTEGDQTDQEEGLIYSKDQGDDNVIFKTLSMCFQGVLECSI